MKPWERVDAAEHIPRKLPQRGVSPCEGCVSPCCWSMKLLQFQATTWHDLEYIQFLTGFPEIDLVYTGPASFRFFYRKVCSYLDTESGRYDCTLHGTPEKPDTCVEYNEHNCFYQAALLGEPGRLRPAFRLDRRRWLAIATLFSTDAKGAIQYRPTVAAAWQAVLKLAPNPAEDVPVAAPITEPVRCEPLAGSAFAPRINPCVGCSAPCCRALLFERRAPHTRASLAFMRYQLGFPGVTVAVTETGWRTLIQTRCRFLNEENGCTLFGQPERPTLCSGYNQYLCDYRKFFSAGADAVLRLGQSEMEQLLASAPLDAAGELPADFGLAAVRALLEQA